MDDAPADYEGLAEDLSVISYPTRLALLHSLQTPRASPEVHISPKRRLEGANQDRPMSRQAIQQHLDRLVEAGLVKVTLQERDGRSIRLHAVHQPRLFALSEEVRRIATLHAGGSVDVAATGSIPYEAPRTQPSGPRLTLVHGVYEGKAFNLGGKPPAGDGWIIGRAPASGIRLDYDPYVSQAHANVRLRHTEFVLEDLGSKNRTMVNWIPLPSGGRHVLRPGDIIGVGRSLLCFAPA